LSAAPIVGSLLFGASWEVWAISIVGGLTEAASNTGSPTGVLMLK
jgi:hypothetical protein